MLGRCSSRGDNRSSFRNTGDADSNCLDGERTVSCSSSQRASILHACSLPASNNKNNKIPTHARLYITDRSFKRQTRNWDCIPFTVYSHSRSTCHLGRKSTCVLKNHIFKEKDRAYETHLSLRGTLNVQHGSF